MTSSAFSTRPARSGRCSSACARAERCACGSRPTTPDRTAGLIPHNSFARLLACEDHPYGWDPHRYQLVLAGFEQAWVRHPGGERRNPSLPRTRGTATDSVVISSLPPVPGWPDGSPSSTRELDVRDVLPAIEAPTLVICRTEDAWFTPEASRYLADRIPHARLVELPEVDHDSSVGDAEGGTCRDR